VARGAWRRVTEQRPTLIDAINFQLPLPGPETAVVGG
jgi:hypothetical protein